MLTLGRFHVQPVLFGSFRLDGGAMFGSVPKNIWSKRIPADAENCIALALRSLLVRFDDRTVLVDCGIGTKWTDKSRGIFAIVNTPEADLGFAPAEITDLVLTHLHFDHAGGISRYGADGSTPEPVYPDARAWVQRANLENAKKPTQKERASYLRENYEPLEKMKLTLTNGSQEIFPDFWVHQVDGHTRGQQYIELRAPEGRLLFPTDLVPTAHHVPLVFHMGYDTCAETLLREKAAFLEAAVQDDALVVFEHDLDTVAGRIGKDERGGYIVRETVAI